ncbi:hypothetical protein [Acinetobacter sp. YH12097]|uniref:hypothetical protein n=1 Tax=Acinetobacter sp. YH12097 TaxID=2601086 RepID=UPI0015D295AD|nr:hypothetical protein [Acinetobacter sp. YH12097]
MLRKITLISSLCVLPCFAQAGLLDAAVAVMGAKNGAIMDQAEARMNQSRQEAANAVAQADRGYASNFNQANQTNNSVYSTSYLKTLDCTDLSVERKTFERTLEASQQALSQAPAQQNNQVSKWAGLAGNALSAFSGQSETAARMGQFATAFSSNKNTQQDSSSAQQAMEIAQANLDNIDIYRQAKKCKN